MELHKIIILSSLVVALLLIILFVIIYSNKSNTAVKNSQGQVSDKKLIEFINSQPDKIVNSQILIDRFGLSKFEAGGRLRNLMTNGILKMLTNRTGMKKYYTLIKPITKSHDLALTEDPFMTVEDLIMIFKHNDYQVSLQDICLSTGLPIKVILEEMKYFEKEKVVNGLLSSYNGGFSYQRIYMLCEPYRSNPESFMALGDANFELKEIYEKIDKL